MKAIFEINVQVLCRLLIRQVVRHKTHHLLCREVRKALEVITALGLHRRFGVSTATKIKLAMNRTYTDVAYKAHRLHHCCRLNILLFHKFNNLKVNISRFQLFMSGYLTRTPSALY